ncbi:uncharacterized protein LOC128711733 [Anopheles marshallii]|uniref:uncharacterized protein LOC128711733 n=1 Tax=Anopheles marshallii TaxID=1521116 RepID=UPI00237A7095|nr:uncharacterized protein LOC128711733 [Anopheles marshallii]
MGSNVPHLLVWSLVWIALLAVGEANSSPCTIEIAQGMLTGLMRTKQTDTGCEGAWNGLQAHLQQAQQNLTECHQRAESSDDVDTAQTSCKQSFSELEKQMAQAREKLNADMKRKLQYEIIETAKAKREMVKLKSQLKTVQVEFKEFYQRLLLVYIDAADTRGALHYYHLLVSLNETNLLKTVVKFVYISPRHANRRLENLLALVKHLPTANEQMELYRLVQPEIMKSTTQQLSYLAMIASLDMGRFVKEKQETDFKTMRDTMFKHILARWKFQMLSGNYQDVVAFAKKYPQYYKKIGARIATVQPQYWFKFSYSQFVTYPNLLPLPNQRLVAFETIARQVKERNKTHFPYYLAKLAKQVDICEKYIKQNYDELDSKEEVVKLKMKFLEFDKKNGYEYYLKNTDSLTKKKPPIPGTASKPRNRGGR